MSQTLPPAKFKRTTSSPPFPQDNTTMDKSTYTPHDCYCEYQDRVQAQERAVKPSLLNFDPLSQLPPWLVHPERLSNDAIYYANSSPWYQIQLRNARRDPNSPIYSQLSSPTFRSEGEEEHEESECVAKEGVQSFNVEDGGGCENEAEIKNGEEDRNVESDEEWQHESLYDSGSTIKAHQEAGSRLATSLELLNLSRKTDEKPHTKSPGAKKKKEKNAENGNPRYESWNPGAQEGKLRKRQDDETLPYEKVRRSRRSTFTPIQRLSKSQEEIAEGKRGEEKKVPGTLPAENRLSNSYGSDQKTFMFHLEHAGRGKEPIVGTFSNRESEIRVLGLRADSLVYRDLNFEIDLVERLTDSKLSMGWEHSRLLSLLLILPTSMPRDNQSSSSSSKVSSWKALFSCGLWTPALELILLSIALRRSSSIRANSSALFKSSSSWILFRSASSSALFSGSNVAGSTPLLIKISILASAPLLIISSEGHGTNGASPGAFKYCVHSVGKAVWEGGSVDCAATAEFSPNDGVPVICESTPFKGATGVEFPFVWD
ncbi:hypothetical protein HYFRA_00002336 [Hymenoscyphus fraxineus]|uniref:Uncharacterized protein n=1 Tax=Hymenoscyphus fraxineus TaxID=746836 RepID=A0A9N9PNG5_9HELO|nr:hypothetical protein HYFRA_00002336 [Hymenoscyphus fraxineus]